MKVYKLTRPLGESAARNTNHPDTLNWRIIHYLDFVGQASDDQISSYCNQRVGGSLLLLKNNKLIEEV